MQLMSISKILQACRSVIFWPYEWALAFKLFFSLMVKHDWDVAKVKSYIDTELHKRQMNKFYGRDK